MPSRSQDCKRLHPSSLLFSAGAAARNLLLPGLAVLFAARGSNYELWLMVLFVPAVVAGLIKYITFSYRLDGHEMVIREGVLTRNERHIPYGRIQNVDLIQNPIHRLLRVAEVRLQTASGDKPEAVIKVLSLAAIEILRDHVFEHRRPGPATDVEGEPPAAPEPSQTLLKLAPGELVLLGLISNRGMAVVAAALGLLYQTDMFRLDRYIASPDVQDWLKHETLPGPVSTALAVLALFLAALVLLRVFSVVWNLVKFYGFTLTRTGDDLRAEYGLLTRVSATIPRHRVQLVSLRSGPLHRLFERTSIQVETAGGAKGEQGQGRERQWLAPLIPAARAGELVRNVLHEIDVDETSWNSVAPGARRRILRRSLVVTVLAAGIVGAAGEWWWALVLGLPGALWSWLHAGLYVKYAGWSVGGACAAYRSGWWQRQASFVLFSKMQAVSLHASPFDRRNRMATLAVDTAGAGRVGHSVDIRYLPEDEARTTCEWLGAEAGRTEFRWL